MWVGVLGPLELRAGGQAVSVAGARLRTLLIRLAVDPGHRVASAELVEAVWPEEPPTDPANALQPLVSRLRRSLGPAAAVQQDGAGYRLGIGRDDLDAAQFVDLTRAGQDQLR